MVLNDPLNPSWGRAKPEVMAAESWATFGYNQASGQWSALGREEAMADLRRILAERNDLYGLADAVIDTSNKTVDASQEELQNMYNIST